MWKLVPLILLAVGVAACGSDRQVVEGPSPAGVSVAFDGSESGLARATENARVECNRTGRLASLVEVRPSSSGRVAYFRCDPT